MNTLHQVLRATSRTFAVGIEGLTPALREPMCLAYLVLRVSDYLEDNTTLPDAEKAALLDAWAATLQGSPPVPELLDHLGHTEDPSPDAMAAHHVQEILQALSQLPDQARTIITTHTRNSTLGMARWVRRGPQIDTEEDLDDYMHEVAGRVGYLITELFSLASDRVRRKRDELMGLGSEFGLALQTVNVVRGIPSDLERGWFFVPRAFLPGSIRTGEEFLAGANRDEAVAVVDRLLDKADRHFQAAERYITLLPPFAGRMRFFCILPFLFGVRTVALSRGNPRVLAAEVKLSREEVKTFARRAAVWGWSDRWVRRTAALLSGPRETHRRRTAPGA